MAQYVLTNVNFDNSYKNACFFPTNHSREMALHPNTTTENLINFNIGNILNTSIVVNNYNNENYCIIHHNNKYYYYFISSCLYLSSNQYKLNLENDVITQYLTGASSDTFSDCLVNRGHCDRWRRTGSNVEFNVIESSPIIQHERQFETVTKTRKNVELKYCDNVIINNWINENVFCWLYIFADASQQYNVLGYSGEYGSTLTPINFTKNFNNFYYNIDNTSLQNDYTVLCVPITKNGVKMRYRDSIFKSIIDIGLDGFNSFLNRNQRYTKLYNLKLSLTPPCDFNKFNSNVFVDLNGNLTFEQEVYYDEFLKGFYNAFADVDAFGNLDYESYQGQIYILRHGCFVNVWQQTRTLESKNIDLMNNFVFDIDSIKGNKQMQFEPKILNDCKKVIIRDSSNGEFVYNMLHFGTREIKALYTEGIEITNNNYYYRIKSSGVIPEENKNNWNGVVNTTNYTLTIANNNLQSFLANNKNFLLTKTASIGIPFLTSLISGNIAGVFGSSKEILNTLINIDNIENRKNSLENVNDSMILNLLVNNGIKLYVDIEGAFETDVITYYNFLYQNGYTINKICNPFDYINTRKYFNYLQCELENIDIVAPENVKEKIKSIFRAGVRLWNNYNQMYNYTSENYEKNLD